METVKSHNPSPPDPPPPPPKVLTNGIQLVNEDNGRRLFLGQSEGVPHQLGSVPDEHLHQLGPGQLQEGGLGLGGTGTCQQRLAGAWGAVQQNTCVTKSSASGLGFLMIIKIIKRHLCFAVLFSAHVSIPCVFLLHTWQLRLLDSPWFPDPQDCAHKRITKRTVSKSTRTSDYLK